MVPREGGRILAFNRSGPPSTSRASIVADVAAPLAARDRVAASTGGVF
jgi:hypothetical protein